MKTKIRKPAVFITEKEKCLCRITASEIPPGMDSDSVALKCEDDPKCPNKGGHPVKTLLETPTLILPKDGLVMSITGTYTDPMELITSAGFSKSCWEFLGPNLNGVMGQYAHQILFKDFGNVNTQQAERQAYLLGCHLLGGQACEAVKNECNPHYQGILAFGRQRWQARANSERILCAYTENGIWKHGFYWTVDVCENALWLLVPKEPLRSSQLHSSHFPMK